MTRKQSSGSPAVDLAMAMMYPEQADLPPVPEPEASEDMGFNTALSPLSEVGEDGRILKGIVMPREFSGTILALKPGEVLRQQAKLHDALAHPQRGLNGYGAFIHAFARRAFHNQIMKLGKADYTEQMMFHPYLPGRSLEDAHRWCVDVARPLAGATSFQVTAEMVDAVTGLYEQSTQGLFHIEEAMLPALSGFIWLDKPVIITDKWGRKVSERVITWSPVTAKVTYPNETTDALGRTVEPPVHYEPGIRLSTWSHIDDDRVLLQAAQDSEQATGYEEDLVAQGRDPRKAWDYLWEEWAELKKIGDLTLSHTFVALYGERHPWSFGKAPHPDGVPGNHEPDNMIAWLYALWMFMGTEVVAQRKLQPGSGDKRKAWFRSIKQNDVNVVLLRRARIAPQPTDDHEARHIDWSCRWLVSGHYRHIDSYLGLHHHAVPMRGAGIAGDSHEVCAICWRGGEDIRITWVKPFLKGPETAPLKASKQLQKLVR